MSIRICCGAEMAYPAGQAQSNIFQKINHSRNIMNTIKKPLVLALALALSALTQAASAAADNQPSAAPDILPDVIISGSRINQIEPNKTQVGPASVTAGSAASSDTAMLLKEVPGVSFYGAGGVSSLPAIHGMADDRIRISIDGMDLISACANHMNSPLSYIDPTQVAGIAVFAGISPVSAGGDSIAGTILVTSKAPEFAEAGATLFKGEAGVVYRSQGNGANVSATLANEQLSVRYSGSTVRAGNYKAASNFKAAAQSSGTQAFLAGDEVGSSRYKSENQALAVALRHDNHVLELKLGLQHIPYQGFPNQRMDMTGNDSRNINLRYTGQYQWGTLEASIYNDRTRHTMNFLVDKLATGSKGMPMETEGNNSGALLKAEIALSKRDTLRVGAQYQRYRMSDWWDPVSATPGMMGGGTFWNINDGQRDRVDVFAEWEARWSPRWLSQIGVRSSNVTMNTGKVQGYTVSTGGMGGMDMGYGDPSSSASIPGAFNAQDRKKTDHNIDLTALARYTLDAETSFEAGYARKTRSPNLYERFAWSTNNTMAMNMNNWFGDANGYVGNLALKPEVAHTISATASWHDAAREKWDLQVTPYITHVENYIAAVSCAAAGKTCPARSDGFVNLSFANQSARFYGVDVAGHMPLADSVAFGTITANAMLSTVRGKNRDSGDDLYNIMPHNAKLAIVQQAGNWTNTVEGQFVGAKTHVSALRKELETAGYSLLNLRSSYAWKQARLDVGIENALDKFHDLPLGGAYIGQQPMRYGVQVPGMGRSLYTALNVKF
jgi:iron complex outermembrane receptor protein